MTAFLFVLTLLLVVSVGVVSGLLRQEKTRSALLATKLESVESNTQLRVTTLNEQLSKCKQAYAALHTKAANELKSLSTSLNEFKSNNETLVSKVQEQDSLIHVQQEKMKRWQVLVDADNEARRIVAEATAEARQLKSEAERVLSEAAAEAETLLQKAASERALAESVATALTSEARTEASETRAYARREADALIANAKQGLDNANQTVKALLAEAEEKARAIAGEAYEVKLNISKYERTLRAIKNEIYGYGDEYIIPTHSLLDDLAEECGYSEAGQQLKSARNVVKDMVKTGRAAECDYVEPVRRETACRFVVDAFNGKVDSILSLVKHDNFANSASKSKTGSRL